MGQVKSGGSTRDFRFASKDLKPRSINFLEALKTFYKIPWGAFLWALNRLNMEMRPVLAGLASAFIFLIFFFITRYFFHKTFSPSEIVHINFDNVFYCIKSLRKDCAPEVTDYIRGLVIYMWTPLQNEVPWLWGGLLLFGYLLAQHVLDWREWHTPFADAEQNRFVPLAKRPPNNDYPCLIVGRGGSGKSTLAQVMENEYLRRKLFKPRGFQDLGSEDELVARSGASIGGDVRQYQVSWRPDMYRVGRLAEAYDMPGQITKDWEHAIADVQDCRRVAIFNVVTYGCNNYIRKFNIKSPNDGCDADLIDEGVLRKKSQCECCEEYKSITHTDDRALGQPSCSIFCVDYLRAYQDKFREKEINDFDEFARAIEKKWNSNAPKLLLVHVVNMADCWIDMSKPNWRQNADAIGKHYRTEDPAKEGSFGPSNALLRKLYRKQGREDDLVIGVLPASFEFGETTHEKDNSDKPPAIFSSTWDKDGDDFDSALEMKVAKQAILGNMTIKTLRALRKELYRQFNNWSVEEGAGIDSVSLLGYEYKNNENNSKEYKDIPNFSARFCDRAQDEMIDIEHADVFDRWRVMRKNGDVPA